MLKIQAYINAAIFSYLAVALAAGSFLLSAAMALVAIAFVVSGHFAAIRNRTPLVAVWSVLLAIFLVLISPFPILVVFGLFFMPAAFLSLAFIYLVAGLLGAMALSFDLHPLKKPADPDWESSELSKRHR